MKTNEKIEENVIVHNENGCYRQNLIGDAPKGNLINEFLWICSGVNRKILRKCPTDFAKFAGIGGTILFTGIMAALSGGYAFYFVFKNPAEFDSIKKVFFEPDQSMPVKLSIGFAFFWGLLIFNLDRFIVNTMYSDGKHTIGKAELISGLPRIIIAVFLGIVISTPLELKIFKDRIESQLVQDNIKRKNDIVKTNKTESEKLDAAENKLAKINNEKKVLYEDWQKAESNANSEAEGTAGTRKVGKGMLYKEKRENADALKYKYLNFENDYRTEIQRLEEEIHSYRLSSTKINEEIKKSLSDGFTARYQAYHNLIHGEGNFALLIASWFITLLFVIIEISPTFLKMMLSHGPYEDLLNAERHVIKVRSAHIISDINDDINTKLKLSTKLNENKSQAELLANKELLDKIAMAQSEIIGVAIERWKEEEMIKIQENPGSYIKSNTERV